MYGSSPRRWRGPAIAVAALGIVGGGLGIAAAGTNETSAATSTIVCPDVAGELPAVPQRAQAEVERNLALLDTQLGEANARLARSANEGGPNFVQNAILGPLAGKRAATIDRIAIAIGRVADRPTGLDGLAQCALSDDAGQPTEQETTPPADEQTTAPPADEQTEPPAAAAGAISCPTVADRLPEIPTQAQAEVARNLALLDNQIAEAERRLATSANEGGPNFVQNAILGPLEDKRVATINRIATAIGRHAAKPVGLDSLAPCALSD
ncbi:hypothetical protein [Mangrovihabitans endophyticus]|uniref:Secreted protein n=1 Tax=Mangrovihabitans endophyticus TaxID=1751298 RepID=A0A8J3BZH9_9ACTN|nr:hypothetical protein [Mangrovihabitans endophyticus]GGK88584.1 hypothetical protein GCM10012284_23320 [Mangrovihabitans endophyticus]